MRASLKSIFSLVMGVLVANEVFAQVPGVINYQGRVAVNGSNFDGTGLFQFALVDGGTNASRQATANAQLTATFVTSVVVTDGGAGYVTPPAVSFTNGGGSGAVANALLGGGAVTGIVVTGAGGGYTSPPTVVIGAPPASIVYQTFWSNGVGTVSAPVTKGLYSVLLGDTTLANMAAIPVSAFTNTNVRLRVWFNGGSGLQQLSPDSRIAAVGYAMNVSGAVGAGLADANTFFISSTAPAGGDGSMGRPWNSLYMLTNQPTGYLNGKTVLLLAGTYTTSADIVFTNTYTNLTIKGLDAQNVCIVSTNNNYRIFTCAGATNLVFDSLTLTSTNLSDNGGAIYLQTGCTAQNCTFSQCYAGSTSAYNYIEGGAVYCNSGGTVQNCTFNGNSALGSRGGGGGVFCWNGGLVQNCTFNGNSVPGTAGYGGGGVACVSGGMVQGCTFNGNSAGPAGGAMCYYGGTIQNCTFNGNTATVGGGVYCTSGGTVQNCTFSGNTATGSGGGVYCYGACTIQHCSIIRGGGTTNSLVTYASVSKWMSVWTNDTSASGFVTYTNSMNN